jgi:pyruvate-formate lyase-activating enzyme
MPFELRTTVVPGIHNEAVLLKMARQLSFLVKSFELKVKSLNWFLQTFQPKNCLDPKFNKLKPYSKIEMEKMLQAVKKIFPSVKLRD